MYTKFLDNNTTFFDVDDTLVLHNVSSDPEKAIVIKSNSISISAIPNTKLINKLKSLKNKGSTIVVWSGGGSDWAEEVVNALELNQYVDCILSKPTRYYDDLDCTEWMPTRKYEV